MDPVNADSNALDVDGLVELFRSASDMTDTPSAARIVAEAMASESTAVQLQTAHTASHTSIKGVVQA